MEGEKSKSKKRKVFVKEIYLNIENKHYLVVLNEQKIGDFNNKMIYNKMYTFFC